MDLTEFDILRRRCLDGDESAWTELYRQLLPLAKWLAAKYGIPNDDAKDIIQKTMITFTEKIGRIRNPNAYLRTVLHHRWVDWLRQRQAGAEVLGTDLNPSINETSAGADVFDAVAATASRATADIETAEALELLRQLLQELKDDCRRLVVSRFLEQRSYREMAQECEVPEPQIGVRLSRCLGYLLERLNRFPDARMVLRALCE